MGNKSLATISTDFENWIRAKQKLIATRVTNLLCWFFGHFQLWKFAQQRKRYQSMFKI